MRTGTPPDPIERSFFYCSGLILTSPDWIRGNPRLIVKMGECLEKAGKIGSAQVGLEVDRHGPRYPDFWNNQETLE